MKHKVLAAVAAAALMATSAFAAEFKADTAIEFARFEGTDGFRCEHAIRNCARSGHNPIFVTGFQTAEPLGMVAPQFQETGFAVIDMVVDLPYVLTVVLMAGFIRKATSNDSV